VALIVVKSNSVSETGVDKRYSVGVIVGISICEDSVADCDTGVLAAIVIAIAVGKKFVGQGVDILMFDNREHPDIRIDIRGSNNVGSVFIFIKKGMLERRPKGRLSIRITLYVVDLAIFFV
jgi:hypothetical protein